MAASSQVNSLQARKRALVAESQLYRQLLRVELQNLQLYNLRLQRRWSRLTSHPALRLATWAGSLLGAVRAMGLGMGGRVKPKPRGRWRRLLSSGLLAWRLYRSYGPLVAQLLARRRAPGDRGSAGRAVGRREAELRL